MDAEAESLIEEIRSAFRDVPRGDLSMHQAHIIKWANAKRVAEVGALDRDRKWTDITDETIQDARNALYGADPLSWRYFIPAYMIWTLRHFQISDSFISDQTIYAFKPHEVGDPLRQHSVLRFDTLSLPQKRCVCFFLRYMAKHPDHADDHVAGQSLENYWAQFCSEGAG